VVVNDLLLAFPTRELYLFRIDDDHGIARIEMWCIGWLVLSSQYTRDSRCKPSKRDTVSIDRMTGSPISITGRDNSFHPSTSWEVNRASFYRATRRSVNDRERFVEWLEAKVRGQADTDTTRT
jgi:hypothetical protein